MKDVKDGLKEFGCKKHGIDYRKMCEECDVMYDKFHDAVTEGMEVQKEYNKARDDDKLVPTLNDTITGGDN